jgi:hypothetical protein
VGHQCFHKTQEDTPEGADVDGSKEVNCRGPLSLI